MRHNSASPTEPDRVLLVADWRVDPQAVVNAIRSHSPATSVALLVPAKLNGLDWAGDPYASVPCAQRQLDRIVELAYRAGLTFATIGVGDPEPLAAISDALADWPAERLVLIARRGRASVERLEVPPVARTDRRRAWLPVRSGHCALEQPQSA
jgi:hypothetical protein